MVGGGGRFGVRGSQGGAFVCVCGCVCVCVVVWPLQGGRAAGGGRLCALVCWCVGVLVSCRCVGALLLFIHSFVGWLVGERAEKHYDTYRE